MINPLIGVGTSLISRLILKDFDISEENRKKALKTIKKIENNLEDFSDLRLENPITWAVTVKNIFKRNFTPQNEELEPETYISFKDLELIGKIPFGEEFLVLNLKNLNIVAKEDKNILYSYQNKVYIHKSYESNKTFQKTYKAPNLDSKKAEEIIQDLYWNFWGKAVKIDKSGGRFSDSYNIDSVRFVDKAYYSTSKEDKVNFLQKCRDKDIRRCWLFDGKPGMGKSVFCFELANQLSERTIMYTKDAFANINLTKWQDIISSLRPTCIIIDDIDRLRRWDLEQKLEYFHEDFCNVPYIFLTSNNMEQLPKALLRSGRIDNIFRVEPESDEEIRFVLNKIAKREQVEQYMTEELMQKMIPAVWNKSYAHAVDYMRKLYVGEGEVVEFEDEITMEVMSHLDDEEEIEEDED